MTFDILLYYGIRVKESSTLNEREIFRIFFFWHRYDNKF